MVAIALINPKIAYNVAAALRACSIFGAESLFWTGSRIPAPEQWPPGARLPREERMKLYSDVSMHGGLTVDHVLLSAKINDYCPVAVEKRARAEMLDDFVHPEKALYVFGPEDGSLPRTVLEGAYRYVCIPTITQHSPLNLAAAVNVVLYDRLIKERRARNEGIPFSAGAYSG